MGDHDAGRVGEHPAQRLLDQRLGVDVERRQRVVEHQDLRPGEHGAGQRQPLALAAGQRHALLADPGVESPRQVVDEAGLGDLDRLADVVVAGVGAAERDVLARAHREQRRLLERRRHDGAQRVEGQVADVDAVDR